MKNNALGILRVIAVALAIFFLVLFFISVSGCNKHVNLFLNPKFETIATSAPFINKEGIWQDAKGRMVSGVATGDMMPDSTYRMETGEYWIMSIKYDRIFWLDQLAKDKSDVPVIKNAARSVRTSVDYGF